MPAVMTVLGPIDSSELGVTHLHEHVLSDFTCYLPSKRERWDRSPITLDTYMHHRMDSPTEANVTLGVHAEAIAELTAFRAAGGQSVVDSTSIGIGRDPEGLVAVSEATGVHVVMGSGWYIHPSLPGGFGDRAVEDLAEEIERDLVDGVPVNGRSKPIRAGFIGEIGLSRPHHPLELRSLAAACLAQTRSGVMLQIHPGRFTESPIEAVRFCMEHGVDSGCIVMSHIERTLSTIEQMLELAATGCVLEFDLFGQESTYYMDPTFTNMPNDGGRIRYLLALAEAGYSEQLAISQDICQRTHTTAFGGEGLHHILTRAVPLMKRMGAEDRFIRQLMVETPARVLGAQ